MNVEKLNIQRILLADRGKPSIRFKEILDSFISVSSLMIAAGLISFMLANVAPLMIFPVTVPSISSVKPLVSLNPLNRPPWLKIYEINLP